MRWKWFGMLATAAWILGAPLACGAPPGPSIEVEDPWARPAMTMKESGEASPGGMAMAGTGAVFMRVINEGGEADRLVGGSTDVAKIVQIHETVTEGDWVLTHMQPRGEVLLKPGSYYVMLIDLQRDLQVGDKFTIELWFLRDDNLVVEVEVREP